MLQVLNDNLSIVCISKMCWGGYQQDVNQPGWRALQEYLDVPQVVNDRSLQQLFVQGSNALLRHISIQPLWQHKPSEC